MRMTTIFSFLALALLLATCASSLWFEHIGRDRLFLVALAATVVASVLLIVSGVVLADGWAERMVHLPVARFYEPGLDGYKRGVIRALFVWPYEAIGLGGFCLIYFGRR